MYKVLTFEPTGVVVSVCLASYLGSHTVRGNEPGYEASAGAYLGFRDRGGM